MLAVEVREPGGPGVMTLVDRPAPVPGPKQARVRVTAIGVNFIDVQQRAGLYSRPAPFVPGGEGVGVVAEVGEDVVDLRVGHRVAWQGIDSSYAEQVVGQADVFLQVPDWMDDLQAAALPLQGMTAHYLATDANRCEPGDTVVVHAGAGGVGMLLTQILKIRGAKVISTVSTPAKAEMARTAGADRVSLYDDLRDVVARETGGVGVAAVYDAVGAATFETSLGCLRTRGTLVMYGQASGPVPPFTLERLNGLGSLTITRPTLRHFVADPREMHGRWDDLTGWLAEGRLVMHIGRIYPLDEAGRAHEELAARATVGKVLLVPPGPVRAAKRSCASF